MVLPYQPNESVPSWVMSSYVEIIKCIFKSTFRGWIKLIHLVKTYFLLLRSPQSDNFLFFFFPPHLVTEMWTFLCPEVVTSFVVPPQSLCFQLISASETLNQGDTRPCRLLRGVSSIWRTSGERPCSSTFRVFSPRRLASGDLLFRWPWIFHSSSRFSTIVQLHLSHCPLKTLQIVMISYQKWYKWLIPECK